MVIELKKVGVPGLASAFIQCQRDESALPFITARQEGEL